MPRQPPLRPLSVFLLKENIDSYEQALRSPESVEEYEIAAGRSVDGVVMVRPPAGKPPWWTEFLAPHLADDAVLARLTNSSTSALLLLTAGGRRFALAFGYGRHLLEPDAYEHDFGLKVVLNVVEPDSLKSIDARTFDELTVHTRRDVSHGSSFEAFGLDVSRDLVRAVTGPPRDETLGRRVTGSDALALVTRVQFEEIPELCERLLAAYASDVYKDRFPWIDHLRPVRDPGVVESLNDLALDALRTREITDLHLAPPETVDWARLAGFTYSTISNPEELDPDPRISAYLDSLDSLDDLAVEKLRRDKVLAIGAEADQVVGRWPVYRCLVFEVRQGDVHYALTGGQWYSVSASFFEMIERFAAGLPTLDLELPDAQVGDTEADYNDEAARSLGALCLDGQLVPTPGGDRVELCDVLTLEKQLLHVKKRGSSSTLSHLFSQGVVSAEMLSHEADFRREARGVVRSLDESFAPAVPELRPEAGEWEVSYVVITRSTRATPLTLPFFSLVNLRAHALRLQDLGYKVTVCQVDER